MASSKKKARHFSNVNSNSRSISPKRPRILQSRHHCIHDGSCMSFDCDSHNGCKYFHPKQSIGKNAYNKLSKYQHNNELPEFIEDYENHDKFLFNYNLNTTLLLVFPFFCNHLRFQNYETVVIILFGNSGK